MTAIAKVPPHNIDAEKATLGAMIIEREAIETVKDILVSEHFYESKHDIIFKTILSLYDHGTPIDIISLNDELKTHGELEKIGGFNYLAELIDYVATAANVDTYAHIVREKAILRNIIKNCNVMIESCYQEKIDEEGSLIKTANEKIKQLLDLNTISKPSAVNITSNEFLLHYQDKLEERKKRFAGGPEMPTGIPELDRMTWGLTRGYVWLIGARTSLGKTSLCVNIAMNIVKRTLKGLLFTTESSNVDVLDRCISSELDINGLDLRTGNLSEIQISNFFANMDKVLNKQLYVCDIASPTIEDIERVIKEVKPDFFIVDYIDRMTLPMRDTEASSFTFIMNRIQTIALENNCAAIVASQLNREVDNRKKEIPKLSDFKNSGGKEEACGTALLLSHAEDSDPVQEERDSIFKMIIWVAKQKNGPTGSVDVNFTKKYTKFKGIDNAE